LKKPLALPYLHKAKKRKYKFEKQKKGSTNLKSKTKLREALRSKRKRVTKPREEQGSTKRYLKVLGSNITKRSVDES
jgi:hypothetical protein